MKRIAWRRFAMVVIMALPPLLLPAEGSGGDYLAWELQRRTNETRSEHGLSWLESDGDLKRIASLHGRDMLARDYIDHFSPEGRDASWRVADAHRRFFGLVGENIAAYDSSPMTLGEAAGRIMSGWMNSPGHRDNILGSHYNVIGVGCWLEDGGGGRKRRCTQLFARAIAYSQDPLPEKAAVGARLDLRFEILAEHAAPTAVAQKAIDSSERVSVSRLSRIGEDVFGHITVKGPPGIYRLELLLRDGQLPMRYRVVPGPLVEVVDGG